MHLTWTLMDQNHPTGSSVTYQFGSAHLALIWLRKLCFCQINPFFSWYFLHLCLSRRHIVLKLTPDGHTKMKHCMIIASFFWQPKFPEDSWSWCWCRKHITGVHMMTCNTLTNGPMCLRCLYDVSMNTAELRDSLGRILRSSPNLKISLIVFPSGVNFGTVWGLLYRHLVANSALTTPAVLHY